MSCSFAGIRIETHFTISLTALRLFRQCMEETFESPRTIDNQISPRDWKEAWMSCLECLEQTEGRVYDLEGEDCIILARVRRLLCVASMDDWSLFLRFWRIMQQCCSWKRSCHKEPPGVTFMPSSAGTIRVSLKLLWATSACCVPRGSLQRRCRCHMPLGCVSQKCNWRRLSGLCDRPRLSVGVRDVRCGCYLVLDLIRIPCAVYTVYSQRS